MREVDLVEFPTGHREDFNHRLVSQKRFLGFGIGVEIGSDDAVIDGHCGNVVFAHDLLQLFGLLYCFPMSLLYAKSAYTQGLFNIFLNYF